MIQRYQSLQAFAQDLDQLPKSAKAANEAKAFNDYQSFEKAGDNLYKGASAEVLERAAKLLEQISGDSIETEQVRWQHDYAGFTPCVPSYLAGEPMAMRRPVHETSTNAPMRVYASVCVSAVLSAADLEARGTAILALCQKLQASRAVELWVYADLEGSKKNNGAAIPCIRIETAPLDLTTASYIFTNAGFLRQLCFAWAYPYGFDGGWAWRENPRSEKAALNRRQALDATGTDLIIPGGFAGDPIVRDPVAWVNAQIAKYTESSVYS